jgi:glycerol kinase
MKYLFAVDQATAGSRAIIFAKTGACVVSALRKISGYFRRPVDIAASDLTIHA